MKNLPESTTQLISKLQQENAFALTSSQLAPVVAVGRSALTVSTTADDILSQFPQLSPVQSDTVARMSLSLQQHSCSDRCTNHGIPGQVCKGFFPQLPSLFSLVARTPLLDDPGKERLSTIDGIHTRLQELLRTHTMARQEDNIATLLSLLRQLGEQPVALPDQSGYSWQSLNFASSPDLQAVLLKCEEFSDKQDDIALLGLYHLSLMTRRHAKYYPARRVSEVYTVKYNPLVLLATEANCEVDLLLHTPHTWFDYMTKTAVNQGMLKNSQKEVFERGDVDISATLECLVENKKREVTLGEAFFLLDPQLKLSSTNVDVKWVSTGYYPMGEDAPGVLKRAAQSVVLNYCSR